MYNKENIHMYDIVILATKCDVPILKKSISLIWENLKPKKVFVIANFCNKNAIEQLSNVDYIDEESILNGLTFETVQNIIERICGKKGRAGWYLQQFIKMAWAYKTEDLYYVVFDADTIPLHRIEYIDQQGKYYFTKKREYHQPYFDTIERLFSGNIKRQVNFSFIAENMIFDTDIMKELIKDIERNNALPGITFYEKILYAVGVENILTSGFSEFETYGNYMVEKYPEKVTYRTLRSLREAMQLLGSNPNREKLEWATRDYDIITIENPNYKKTLLTSAASSFIFRKLFRLKHLVRIRTGCRSFYRRLAHKEDLLFD